jgi:hypothetical protein
MDPKKSEAAAYAPEIEMLTRALANLNKGALDPIEGIKDLCLERKVIRKRLRVLLDFEEAK